MAVNASVSSSFQASFQKGEKRNDQRNGNTPAMDLGGAEYRIFRRGVSRALPVADKARRTSGSGQNFGGLNAAAKFWAPQQDIAAEIGAKNMPVACFLNAPTSAPTNGISHPLRLSCGGVWVPRPRRDEISPTPA